MSNKKDKLTNALFIAPGMIIYIVFMLVPISFTFFYAFTSWDGISPTYKMVGLRNFQYLLNDKSFSDSIITTLIITATTAIALNVFGIVFAVLLDGIGRAYKIGKSGIFIPAVLSSVVVSFLWSYMTQTRGGIINYFLNMAGLPSIDFYQSNLSITFMVSGVIIWGAFGFYTTVYDATLKTIPEELYEAAKVDGASVIQRFFRVTLPLMTPGITINGILAVIWGLKQYDFVKIMTPGSIQTIAVNAVERAFDYNRLAYACAIVLVLFIFTSILSALQLYVSKKAEVDY